MSTEAIGDGKPDAVGATGPTAGADGAADAGEVSGSGEATAGEVTGGGEAGEAGVDLAVAEDAEASEAVEGDCQKAGDRRRRAGRRGGDAD